MAGIADLLKLLSKEALQSAAPSAGGNGQGVAGMLGSTSPDAMMSAGAQMSGNSSPDAMMTGNPAPQTAPGQVAPDPTQAPSPAPITQGAPPPFTPPSDAGAGGLSGFLSHMVEKAKAVDPETGMSFADRFGRFAAQTSDLAGLTSGGEDRWQNNMDRNTALHQRAQLQQMADHLGMTPREKLIFMANPEKWVEARAKGLEPTNVPGGATRVNPGENSYTAPLVGQEKGEAYSISPTGAEDLGSLAVSNQQRAEDKVREAQQAAIQRFHEIMAGAAVENAQSNRIRANRAPATAGASASLPPNYVPR